MAGGKMSFFTVDQIINNENAASEMPIRNCIPSAPNTSTGFKTIGCVCT